MSTAALDPRLRARRRLIARGVFRRRRWILVVAAVLAIAGAGVWVVLSTSVLGVRQIELRGATRTAEAEVLAAAGIEPGTPLARLAAAEIELRIETLPWVANATVTRKWPSTVDVVVHERHAVVVLAVGSSWAQSDLSGRVLAVEPGFPGLTEVRGPLSDPLRVGSFLPAAAAGAVRVAAIVPDSLKPQIKFVSWTGNGEVLVELTRGGIAELGRAEDPMAQLVSLSTVLSAVPPGPLEIVDLRAPAVPVVRSNEPPPPVDEPVEPAFPINGELPAVAAAVPSEPVPGAGESVPGAGEPVPGAGEPVPDGAAPVADPGAAGTVSGVGAPALSTP